MTQRLERAVASVDHRTSAGVLGLLGPPHVGGDLRHLAGESPHRDERARNLVTVAAAELRLGVVHD
jgi:hypothetical protein